MDFAFAGIDNEDLKRIFPNEYDTAYDAATDLEWLFYGNEWTVCNEGRRWQKPDQYLERMLRGMLRGEVPDLDQVAFDQWTWPEAERKHSLEYNEDQPEDMDQVTFDQWIEAWPEAERKHSLDYDEDMDQDPLDYEYDYDDDQDLIKD